MLHIHFNQIITDLDDPKKRQEDSGIDTEMIKIRSNFMVSVSVPLLTDLQSTCGSFKLRRLCQIIQWGITLNTSSISVGVTDLNHT